MDEIIDKIQIIDGNLEHIARTKKISGSLRTEIKIAMITYHEQQVKKEISNIMPNKPIFSLNFIQWYSGMDASKILTAYSRYKREVSDEI
jgi:hypothetical protein